MKWLEEEKRALYEIQHAQSKANELLTSYNNSEFKSKLDEFKQNNQ